LPVPALPGYHGEVGARRTTRFCATSAFFAVTSAVVGSTQTNFSTVLTLVWLVLFFGGAIVPGATGLVLAAVPARTRALSSAMLIFVSNIFGYIAGTMVPALYMQWQVSIGVEYKESVRRGWQLLLCWSLWAVFFFGIAAVITSAKWSRWWGKTTSKECKEGPPAVRTRGFRNPKIGNVEDGNSSSDYTPKGRDGSIGFEGEYESASGGAYFLPPMELAVAVAQPIAAENTEEVGKGQKKKRRRRKGVTKVNSGSGDEDDGDADGDADIDDSDLAEVLDQMKRMAASLELLEKKQQEAVKIQEDAARMQEAAAQRQEKLLRLLERRQESVEKEQKAAANGLSAGQ
jgi:hypothetical protein